MRECPFSQSDTDFLGHVVSLKPEGVNRKVAAVAAPTSLTELRSILGLTNYFCRFIQGNAQLARPLNHLTKKDGKNPRSVEQDIVCCETLQRPNLKSPKMASILPCWKAPALLSCWKAAALFPYWKAPALQNCQRGVVARVPRV